MKKSELLSCLDKVFLNDWSPNEPEFLKKLTSLLAYYSSEDLKDLSQDVNKLHLILLKYDIYCTLKWNPSNVFDCGLSSREPVTNFTFSPQISADQNVDWDRVLSLAEELEKVNIYALISYVKEKAVAAGDFNLE